MELRHDLRDHATQRLPNQPHMLIQPVQQASDGPRKLGVRGELLLIIKRNDRIMLSESLEMQIEQVGQPDAAWQQHNRSAGDGIAIVPI